MKKFIVGCFCLAALASCNVKNSDEYKRLQAERDSLMQKNAQGNSEIAEMMSVINEVEENFSQIKEAEKYLSIESKNKGEMTTDTKERIRDNFEMINEIMKKNKADLAQLNQRLKNTTGETGGLKKTIERLNAELAERGEMVLELQASLNKRNAQIAELEINVKTLSENVEDLSSQATVQAETIKEQDKALNTAYYMFGTSKELKEAKVITGGFLASNKILKEGIEKSKFITVDIRQIQGIPVFSKKAKVLSDHPKDSYSIVKDDAGSVSVNITDYQRFWSLTKFLVIEVN